VFKGKNTRGGVVRKEINQRKGFPSDVELMAQENAWFDEHVMLDWIERVWKREVAVDPVYYLLLDTLQTHMTSKVKRAFHSCNTTADFIPGGYTSKLQMLDVGVNYPFKQGICDEFEKWISSNSSGKPQRYMVAQFISHSWSNITKKTITNSWKRVFGFVNYKEFRSNYSIMMDRNDPLALEP
jgi:hypothetical protein